MAEVDLLQLSEDIIEGRTAIESHHPVMIGGATTLAELAPDVAFVESFANVAAFRTEDGMMMIDAGSPLHAAGIVEAIRGWTDQRLHTAVFTHGHVDHIYAVKLFEAEGNGPAHVVAHEALPDRFRRYERTSGYNGLINQRQFQLGGPYFPGDYRYPDETYRALLEVQVGDTHFMLRHDRGETDDHTWVWMPERSVLCTGDLFIWASPNCGNPQKAQRYCDEWAVALRAMAELGAELLLPGHGLPIAGAERIRGVLTDTADYLDSLFTQTIDLMNAGARLNDIIHTVTPPAELIGRPWLQPVYDEPEFVVRNIWRLYGGWYDGNPASLKPASEVAVGVEIAAMAGGADKLAERALELSAEGDHRLACHLIEMASAASPDVDEIRAARATVFGARADVERSTMAKGVYSWAERESSPTA